MIPPKAQEHLGMFSANVITASVSGQLFKEPLLLLSHFNTWWCHGPLWGRRNSSNQLPLMTFSFIFFSLPFAQFFLPLFLSLVHNRGSLYGLIKRPSPIGFLCFWSYFMRNACPCLNVLIVLVDVPVFCPPGLLKSKKFKNMEKGLSIQHCAEKPISKHIWLQTYCSLRDQSNAAWRISPILLPLSVAERNVIWQTNVVTDSLSGGFYDPSALLVHGYTSPLNS